MRGLLAPLIKLVVFLVITTLATYVLAVTISNSTFGSTYSYKAQFDDVTGLNIGDDVRIAGVRVGTVENIKLIRTTTPAPNCGGGAPAPTTASSATRTYAEVDFTVQRATTLTQSVIAQMRYRNLIGQRYIDIEQGTGDPNQILKPGSTISQCQTRDAVDLTVLFQGFQPLTQALNATQINQLTYSVIQALQGEGGSFVTLAQTLGDLTNTLADKDKVIGEVIDNLSGVLVAVNQHNTGLGQLIDELKDLLSGLAADRDTIGNSITGINNLATSTAGLLSQVRAPLASDIKDITTLVANLNANSDTIQYVVQQLPPTVAGLIRTASYGSWFNFYLCSLSGIITVPGGHTIPVNNLINGGGARCQ